MASIRGLKTSVQIPLDVGRTHLPESAYASATINIDLEIQVAGQTVQDKRVASQRMTKRGETQITGTIPATLSDFKTDSPSLLTMPVKNDIPVHVDLTRRPMLQADVASFRSG